VDLHVLNRLVLEDLSHGLLDLCQKMLEWLHCRGNKFTEAQFRAMFRGDYKEEVRDLI